MTIFINDSPRLNYKKKTCSKSVGLSKKNNMYIKIQLENNYDKG